MTFYNIDKCAKVKFVALHRQRLRFKMSEKFLSGTKNPKQTNNQTRDLDYD